MPIEFTTLQRETLTAIVDTFVARRVLSVR